MSFLQKIKQAFSCCPGNDSTDYPQGQCGYNGKTAKFVRLMPYGLSALEPTGSFVFVINSQGLESVKYGIPSAMMDRLKNLSEGEVAVYNSITGVYVYLKADGTVEISGDTTVDGDLTVTGDVQIDGALSVTGATTMTTVTCDSISINGIDFSSHVHGGVSTGTGTSGGPQ